MIQQQGQKNKPTAVPTVIINQETVSPGKTTSALHEESIVQIAALLYQALVLTFMKVSSEDDDPAKIDRGVQVKIKSSKEEILEKKTKILKQKVARQTKKIQDISSLIATIKKYTGQSEIENIIQGRFADICKDFKKPQSNPHGVRYSEEVKAFALTLNFYSPKAYEFLRKYISLPHVETIRRSLSLFNCNVGFLSEVLEYLKEQVKTPEKKIYLKNVALIFDGMALKQNLAYDQKLDKVVGYVDLEPIPVNYPEKLASEALVFKLCLTMYVLIVQLHIFIANNLSGELLSELIKTTIILLDEIGVTVRSLTCDGASSNVKAYEYLGCSLEQIKTVLSTSKREEQYILSA
ncbi:unnamed protein product [Parnassius apollo]|uniref:(apollo) hypothetical protein n=1 Tax=Parnassius apollo TaxID=110799 RepID=A0A8S3Y936_PARAO|nr:unnamed protein product [Parnassius apollo]